MARFDKNELNRRIEQMLGFRPGGTVPPRLINFLRGRRSVARRQQGRVPPLSGLDRRIQGPGGIPPTPGLDRWIQGPGGAPPRVERRTAGLLATPTLRPKRYPFVGGR